MPRGPRSSPLVSQHDLFKRNQGESDGERGRDREIKRDRRDRDSENWERYVRDHDRGRSRDARRCSREKQDENKRPQSSKRSKKVDKVSILCRLQGRQVLSLSLSAGSTVLKYGCG